MNRRSFLIGSTFGVGGMINLSIGSPQTSPLLSYSTLGCPKWNWDTILNYATKYGYQGVEIRGVLGQLDLVKCPEFVGATSRKESLTKAKNLNVKIVGLGSSAKMHLAEPNERTKQLDDAKRFIELAHDLECPYVRVFPDDLPKNQDRKRTIELITAGLLELGQFAAQSKVSVLLESHGQVVSTALLLQIMEAAKHPNTGLIWDIVNMWNATKEEPSLVVKNLHSYIRHVHVKDIRYVEGKEQYVLINKGLAPLQAAVQALSAVNYQGYYSFEWEKMWHPEIEEPEVAIPDFPQSFRRIFE